MTVATSVVIPVHGRAGLTGRCLDLVLAGLPGDAEVIVVDDASPDSTAAVLAGYRDAIRVVRLEENGGFARACNAGAAAARGGELLFLNNDVEPGPGWLAALRGYLGDHPEAASVGARLLYPNGTVQHAGVVFGQDGYPHNVYAGFPGDHPAVNRPRRLQAVTGACMLVRAGAFAAVGGFDEGFLNSLEDVDLCLRIAAAGAGEIHYCPAATLVHLESASRGRRDRFERSLALYRERWRGRVRRDDLDAYVEDGLLGLEYGPSYPARIAVDPQLAVVATGRESQIERLLEAYATQTAVLLEEVVRLSAEAVGGGGAAVGDDAASGTAEANGAGRNGATSDPADREAFLARARRLEAEVRALQAEAPGGALEPGPRLGYADQVEQVRAAVAARVPAGAAVVVVSRGDRDLVRLDGVDAGHFPQDGAGGYAGHHPADGAAAIAELERLREGGAEYLVLPPSASWWLEHYPEFARHLGSRYALLEDARCRIYELGARVGAAAERTTMGA
ncbi:MAG: glycosyltransferase family 2 protein [Actinobacteria bacterium]|nr:glycosyltransferase family 2 protein [Actinomycetota bacterium]